MGNEPTLLGGRNALTRIKVTGARDYYMVQNGNDAPVKVWIARGGLRCECGSGEWECTHIESLRLCGFTDDVEEMSRAA